MAVPTPSRPPTLAPLLGSENLVLFPSPLTHLCFWTRSIKCCPPTSPSHTSVQVPQFQDWVRIVRRDDCDNGSRGKTARVMGGRPGWVAGKSAHVKAKAGESALPTDCTAASEEVLTCEERCVLSRPNKSHTCQDNAEALAWPMSSWTASWGSECTHHPNSGQLPCISLL